MNLRSPWFCFGVKYLLLFAGPSASQQSNKSLVSQTHMPAARRITGGKPAYSRRPISPLKNRRLQLQSSASILTML
ncbi:hypothetical protein EJ06DRAFT_529368 [Trichodelitschia bisporula]|uniref:Secreted protein n=1 Tax=Trichodelitschia bisporula TaxID=703511 RepID=A0A6G1HZH9_9PEZI|nr:hypothetical protein EJ06DRAFT_529368 [Trichodelitschia bisporula]